MKRRLLTVIPFLLGLFLCGYPLISSILERQHQQSAVATYEKTVETEDTEKVEQTSKNAKRYNELLWQANGAIVGDYSETALSDEMYQKMLNLRNDEKGIMGTLRIPKISMSLPIYHGTSDEVLENGVGHLQGSSLPIGGENTRSVLTGHRGLPNSKLFTRLDELEEGDLFFLDVCGEKLAYRVNEIQVIKPEEADSLGIQAGKDLVSLVTCTPYGINTHRLVVTGERIEYQEGAENQIKGQMMSPRELLFAAMPLLFILYAVINLVRTGRRNQRNEKKERRKRYRRYQKYKKKHEIS